MVLANEFAELTHRKNDLEAELGKVKERLGELQPLLLDAIEQERFPSRATVKGLNVYVQRRTFASPKEDRKAVAAALVADGLTEYVKEDYNANSLSAFVRDCEREGVPIPPNLDAAIKVTEKFEVRAARSPGS